MNCSSIKRYAVYGSGKCNRVKRAIEAYPDMKKRIICVITDEKEDEELKNYFDDLGIDYYSFNVAAIDKSKDRNVLLSDFILNKLEQYEIDYCFTFGKRLLKGRLLKAYNYRLINFHPGIIPEVIGLNAIDKALNEGKRYIGNTVHFIDEGMDSGPIIMQSMILADNFGQYGYNIFLDGMTELIWRTVNLLESNRIEIADRKVIIKEADYTVSRIFPDFNI